MAANSRPGFTAPIVELLWKTNILFQVNGATDADEERNKKFGDALIYFIEATSELNIAYLAFQDLTTVQVRRALNIWRTIGISVFYEKKDATIEGLEEITQKDTVKVGRKAANWALLTFNRSMEYSAPHLCL